MSFERPFAGYPGKVFATAWQSALWLASLLASGSSTPGALAQPALAVFQTCMNGADAVALYQASQALSVETQNLAMVQALPITITPTQTAYFVERISGITAASVELPPLLPAANPFGAVPLLIAGQPAIVNPGFLEWASSATPETAPTGMTAATMPADAAFMASTWRAVANAVAVVQGSTLTTAYDAAARQYRVSAVISNGATLVSGSTGAYTETGIPALWNGIVAVPTMLLDAASLVSSPAQLANQQAATVRYVLRMMALQVAYLLLSLRSPITATVTTASLRRNETLMDLAARAAGGYEEWSAIAALNNLQPPWPGPTNQALAASGTQLLLPGSSLPPSGSPAPTYAANVLGIDFDFGPINGPQPPWRGDIQLISGLSNYRRALGRRLQTPLGALVYHPDYGSRIPPEVGAVQSQDEAARLASFGSSAMAADPRTADVASATASVQPGFLATFSGVAIPIGPGALPVAVNEIISPLP